MYDKETLLASVDCIELARYLGMPIEKHGSSYFTQCVSGSHHETQLDHNKIYSNGCYCFSCGKRYDAAGMVMAYYENVLGQSINFQEALGIIGDSLGGRNAFLVGKHVQFSPFPLTDEELQAIGLQPKAGSGKVIESAETDEDGYWFYKEKYVSFGSIKMLYTGDKDAFMYIAKKKCEDALCWWNNLTKAIQLNDPQNIGWLNVVREEYTLAKNAYIKLGGKIKTADRLFSL